DIERHLKHMRKHVIQLRKTDMKRIAKKSGYTDYNLFESRLVLSSKQNTNVSDEMTSEISHDNLREYPLVVLSRPIIKISTHYLTSSLLLLNSFMHFIQNSAKSSPIFRTRKGMALEACIFNMIRGYRLNKLIVLQSDEKEQIPVGSWGNIQSIRSESSKWGIPLEEMVIPNLSRPFMEFDLVLEDNIRPPLFLEIKANTFSAMEYALGKRLIENRMLDEHRKLREKLIEVQNLADFRKRFGSEIEGLLVSQDSVFSIGYLDITGKNPQEAYEHFRNLVPQFGVSLDGFGTELVSCFQTANLQVGTFHSSSNDN
ncbi:MAG: hypothetical protein ACW98Y_05950, partial [Candidatus Thorarchaeota archaeon]